MTTDVLAYSDKRHWETLKMKVSRATDRLRGTHDRQWTPACELTGWEREDLADTLDLLADYAAILRSQLVTAMLERRQSEEAGAQ